MILLQRLCKLILRQGFQHLITQRPSKSRHAKLYDILNAFIYMKNFQYHVLKFESRKDGVFRLKIRGRKEILSRARVRTKPDFGGKSRNISQAKSKHTRFWS